MYIFTALSFILSICCFADTKILNEAISVNPYMLPGDSEHNPLALPGIQIHEANDFYGKTDKFITEAMSLRVMSNWGKYFSTSIKYKGRFVTPALRPKNGEEKFPTPLGIYAEWAETTLNQSVTLFEENQWGAFKVDAGLGYNDFGNHNFAKIYRGVHERMGSPDERDQFGTPESDNFISSTVATSFIIPIGDEVNIIASYQVMNSKVFREDAQEITLIWSRSENLAFSAKYSFVKQIRSEFYRLKDNRIQYAGSIRLFKYWTPSIFFISPYVEGDKYGQWYLSPLSLTYPF